MVSRSDTLSFAIEMECAWIRRELGLRGMRTSILKQRPLHEVDHIAPRSSLEKGEDVGWKLWQTGNANLEIEDGVGG